MLGEVLHGLVRELRLGREPAAPSTGSGTGPRAAASSSSTASTSSTSSPAGSARAGSRRRRSGSGPGTVDRGARPLHGPLRRRGAGQLLPRLPPGRADGPPGTPARLRARRRDPLRLGADPRPDPRGRGRAADPRPLRPVPRRQARRRRLLRRQGPRLPGPRQGDRRLPDDRALVRATARRSRRSTAELLRVDDGRTRSPGSATAATARVVTEANGRDSLALACEADALAHRAGAGR